MADTTPEPTAPDPSEGADSKPAPRKKAPARKPAAKAAAKPPRKPTARAAVPAAEVVATPDPEPAPASAAPTTTPTGAERPAPARTDRSVLDGVRDNQMGPLTAGLIVAVAVGLLLSVLVPNDPSALAMLILGALLSAAVGFSVRYLSHEKGLRRQIEAFIAAMIGVHLMSVTGVVGGEIPLLAQLGAEGPGFNEAILAALATPSLSTGAVVAGLVAAIIVGWSRSRPSHDTH